jgi:hypothetical protein
MLLIYIGEVLSQSENLSMSLFCNREEIFLV